MMNPQQNINHPGGGSDPKEAAEVAAGGQLKLSTADTDALLDEIDSLLESNAEEFVRGYVQKGGQ